MVRETLRFSVFAYVTTLGNIILTRTDQLVLSTALAVSAVALYQAGAKVAEMFGSFMVQIPDTLSPAAAHLNAKGDKEFLRKLLIDGARFSVLVTTPLYLICAFYLEHILRLLTGSKALDPQIWWVGQTLLLWQYVTVVTQSVSKRIFMMCGHEKRLMWLGVGEALLNLALSLGLIFYYRNVVSVAVGSLLATAIFGWGYIWPWAAREASLGGWKLARLVLVPTWVACIPLLCLILLERSVPQLDFQDNFSLFVVEALLAMALAAGGVWKLGLNADERMKFLTYFGKYFRRGAAS
jgi:O-antigen/teichoic acid export membrane protein